MPYRKFIAVFLTFFSLSALAEPASSVRWKSDIVNSFGQYEKAWASYQLLTTFQQYDVGDYVSLRTFPESIPQLFSTYRFSPLNRSNRTIQLIPDSLTSETSKVRVCVSATLASAADLSGFLSAMKSVNASLATAACQPGDLTTGFSYPVQLSAYKDITAHRAMSLLAKDRQERAAQAAVADVIGFGLPAGNLLDFEATIAQSSASNTAILTNTSLSPWSIASASDSGPFHASVQGCHMVLPGESCSLTVSFLPVAQGRTMGFVTVVPVEGKSLTIRVGGTAH